MTELNIAYPDKEDDSHMYTWPWKL